MKKNFFRKIRNSFLTPRSFEYLINDKAYELFFSNNLKTSFLERIIYFWPRIMNASSWRDGNTGAYRDPNHFIEMRENIDEKLLKKIMEINTNKCMSIMDLGCNTGRHLNYLHKEGMINLNGIDVMQKALDNFKTIFPETVNRVNIHHDLFQRFLINSSEDKYDIVYSVGATIELVHPSFDIIKYLCKISNEYILLLINEDDQEYPRFYVYEFKNQGFQLIDSVRPISNTDISYLCFKKVTNLEF